MSYIVLRGRWFNIIVFNMRDACEEKSDDSKDSFYEELEQVFHHSAKYYAKKFLEEVNAKLGRDDIFKRTIGIMSLHYDIYDNGVRIVIFAASKI